MQRLCAVLASGSRLEIMELANAVRVEESSGMTLAPGVDVTQLAWTRDGQLITLGTSVRPLCLRPGAVFMYWRLA